MSQPDQDKSEEPLSTPSKQLSSSAPSGLPTSTLGSAPAPAAASAPLQKQFVAFLFAFAGSVVAQQIAQWLAVATNNWKSTLWPAELMASPPVQFWTMVAIGTHSLLALLMLSMSWVMWSRSNAAGHLKSLTEVFSIGFVTFGLEIVLVTVYFSLARTVEGDFAAWTQSRTIASYLTEPSARPEAAQMVCVFALFMIWDAIVDVGQSPKSPALGGFGNRVADWVTGCLTYCSVSFLCMLAAVFVYYAGPEHQTPTHAVVGDIALMAVLLLFYQGKILEHYLFMIFPTEASRDNTKRTPTGARIKWVLVLLLVYAACLATMIITTCCQKSSA